MAVQTQGASLARPHTSAVIDDLIAQTPTVKSLARQIAATMPMVALLCHRCDRPFKTTEIRQLCAHCTNGGAIEIPDGAAG